MGAPGARTIEEWELRWQPSRDFLQDEYPACMEVLDTLNRTSGGLPAERDTLCVQFKVMRCRYCPTEGQSLMEVAHYWWGSDWIQIWGANAHIRNPLKVQPNELLTLGPTYTVKRGDTMSRLADRFGVTRDRLELLNPHARGGGMAAGMQLCVMPEVCPGQEHTVNAPRRPSYVAGQ
mmetsp:Transcript_23938/g.57373  ORF Transcript_23938/g.57373 Transcript_23938/m.57373 type:complete len:177 (+) Transcript_23938:1-531(+)